MKRLLITILSLGVSATASTAGSPDVVWQVPNPNIASNNVLAVGWSPASDVVAVGSSDRWFRVRRALDGVQSYAVLEPPKTSGVGQIFFSTDGELIGVQNRSSTMSFIVQRASDGVTLGRMIATVGQDGLVTFAPDSQLQSSAGGDGTLSRWRFSDVTIFQAIGSGYERVITVFNFSPDGAFQTAASGGRITIRRRSDAAIVQVLSGGSLITFSDDSALIAAWSATPTNEIDLWRTSDWSFLRTLPSTASNEGVSGLRFTPNGQALVSTGYLPYIDQDGLWQQKGIIRFWRVSDGSVLTSYDSQTDIGVTARIAWSPDGSLFAYGLYDGSAAVARTPISPALDDRRRRIGDSEGSFR
jgi:WD40 repeat protein